MRVGCGDGREKGEGRRTNNLGRRIRLTLFLASSFSRTHSLRIAGNPTMVAREASTSEAMARVLEKGRARQAEVRREREEEAAAR